jgi:hypothetical protein
MTSKGALISRNDKQWLTQEFFRGGGSSNSVEDRGQIERGSGGGSPLSGVPLYLQMGETRITIRLLRMCFPRNWEFGSALSYLQNFGVGEFEPPTPLPPPRYATDDKYTITKLRIPRGQVLTF